MLREEQKLRLLSSSAAQCAQLTGGMLDILAAFELKLKGLQTAMLPVHRGTEQLIQAQKSLSTLRQRAARSTVPGLDWTADQGCCCPLLLPAAQTWT